MCEDGGVSEAFDAVTSGGTTLSCNFEGGTAGTGFPAPKTAPQGAVQFTREIWMDVPPQPVMVYVTEAGKREHLDGSPCPGGLDMPLGEWTQVMIPFRCAEGRAIRHKTGAPFWLDDLPLSADWPGPAAEDGNAIP